LVSVESSFVLEASGQMELPTPLMRVGSSSLASKHSFSVVSFLQMPK